MCRSPEGMSLAYSKSRSDNHNLGEVCLHVLDVQRGLKQTFSEKRCEKKKEYSNFIPRQYLPQENY